MKKSLFQRLQVWVINLLTKVRWKPGFVLTDSHKSDIRNKLTSDYYIIATRRSNLLTTPFINFGHFILTGNWGYYSHTLMNLENEVNSDDDFIFIEATTHGTKISTFDEVFNGTSAVSLIKPRGMSIEEWTIALDKTRNYLGRPYDNLFDLKSDLEINCVELIRLALQTVPDYESRFANFEKLLAKKKKLTPQMFLECPDFEVVFEITKRSRVG